MASSTSVSSEEEQQNRRCRFQLPELELPKFSGDPLEYCRFKQVFMLLIGNNDSLDNPTKLLYLESLLDGEPKDVVFGVPFSSKGYILAWKTLDEEYNDTVIIGKILYKKFIELPKAEDNPKCFTQTINQLKRLINQFEEIGLPIDKVFPHETIIKKFPSIIENEINRRKIRDKTKWNTETLIKELKYIIREERIVRMRKEETPPTVLVVPTQNDTVPNPKKTTITKRFCDFCGSNNHNNILCRSPMIVHQKLDIIRRLNLCHNCFIPDHQAIQCDKTSRCNYCAKKHHTTICDSAENRQRGFRTFVEKSKIQLTPRMMNDNNQKKK